VGAPYSKFVPLSSAETLRSRRLVANAPDELFAVAQVAADDLHRARQRVRRLPIVYMIRAALQDVDNVLFVIGALLLLLAFTRPIRFN